MTETITVEAFRKIPKARKQRTHFDGEAALAALMTRAGVKFERQFRFDPKRRWRADFKLNVSANSNRFGATILIEFNGGVFSHMGHSTGVGISKDYEKWNAAVLGGYRVLNFTKDHVKSGYAMKTILEALGLDRNVH